MNATPGIPPCPADETGREEAHALMQRMGVTFSDDNRLFIIFAQIYLILAGLGLLVDGGLLADNPHRPAFLHLLTLGFLLFMIYGLGAHMLPRFTGNPLPGGYPMWLQMGCAHLGVLGYAAGYFLEYRGIALAGALLAWLGLAIFTWRVWRVLWPHPR